MKKFGLVIAALTFTTAFATNQAMAQSAKFAADWATNTVTLAEIVGPGTDTSGEAEVTAAELMASIKVPQGKELLIGVSGEASLVTFTEVKGRNNGPTVTASSEATMDLEVRFAPKGTQNVCWTKAGTLAVPGAITFASRKQTLALTVAGFENADSMIGEVTVALENDTTAAHHFNFLAVNLDSGEYDIWACFGGEAIVSLSDAELADGLARVAIKKRIITVQEVRAVNSDFIVE